MNVLVVMLVHDMAHLMKQIVRGPGNVASNHVLTCMRLCLTSTAQVLRWPDAQGGMSYMQDTLRKLSADCIPLLALSR